MAYLSDLEPSKVEETPYFGRRCPYRRDVALDGSPLKLEDQPIAKGLAVHSRTALTYDLDRRYDRFETLVGFDASAGKKGRVTAGFSPTARSCTPIPTSGPACRRSTCPCPSRAPNSSGSSSTSVPTRTLAIV